MKLRSFIFGASAAVGAAFFLGSWVSNSQSFESVLRDHLRHQSEDIAHLTFSAMYEIMSRGWTREELERFVAILRETSSRDGFSVELYRTPVVEALYGQTEQSRPGPNIKVAIETAERHDDMLQGRMRSALPFIANDTCLNCHRNARAGEVLGVLEITQPFEQTLRTARSTFQTNVIRGGALGLLLALAAVWWVQRRITRSVSEVEGNLASIARLADLRQLELARYAPGFEEFDRVQKAVSSLAQRLRTFAVDKDILMFEVGLLEKFVITSDVIRDWREYVGQLLQDVNTVLYAPILFSVFQTDDEMFDVEVFWYRQPGDLTRARIETAVLDVLRKDERFRDGVELQVHHHFPAGEDHLALPENAALELQIKSLFVDSPKIGSIVGIGVHSDSLHEPSQQLVLDSILSTLLNVVGSIKAIHKYTRDLEYYATRDPLTDLFNQRVFWELLGYELNRSTRHDAKCTLLMIDLDNFKLINDHFGHAIGDVFLQSFARAIHPALRGGDILARYAGDEFVVLLPETDLEQGYAVAQRVLEAARTVSVDAGERGKATASVSIGLAVYPDHATEPKDMFLFADTLMYKAKAEGKERVALPSEHDVMEAFRTISDTGVAVMNALNARKVIPFFQPIVAVDGKGAGAVEVLSRIEIDGKVVRAERFIEVAEKMGIIHRLDAMVIETALEAVHQSGFDGHVFFNLSPRALVMTEFIETLRSVVRASPIPPERIVFEITERDTVKNLSLLERFFVELKSEGFGLAIDDFGSGFSSFHYLRRFPFDFLKIEGDFIANMLHSERDRIFVRSINDLARALEIRVIAEYVESEAVLEMIRSLEIDYAQGYHVGRPTPEPPGRAATP